MDSGRGWNPTTSGDKYYYRVLLIQWPRMSLCLIGMFPETNVRAYHCPLFVVSNLTITVHAIQDRRRGQKTDGQLAMNAFLWTSATDNPGYTGFQEKNPALILERYRVLYSHPVYSRSHIIIDFLSSYDIDTATRDVSTTGLFRTLTGWICERSRWTGP